MKQCVHLKRKTDSGMRSTLFGKISLQTNGSALREWKRAEQSVRGSSTYPAVAAAAAAAGPHRALARILCLPNSCIPPIQGKTDSIIDRFCITKVNFQPDVKYVSKRSKYFTQNHLT